LRKELRSVDVARADKAYKKEKRDRISMPFTQGIEKCGSVGAEKAYKKEKIDWISMFLVQGIKKCGSVGN